MLHSSEYRDLDQIRGKRVLVVGGGNSACDIVVDAGRGAARAVISMRRGYWFIPKHVFGVPSDVFADSGPKLPAWLEQRVFGTLLNVLYGKPEKLGLQKPDHKLFETHPVLNSNLFLSLQHGDVTAKPGIITTSGSTVTFVDGSSEDFDMIIYATGYLHAVPYAQQYFGSDQHPDLYLTAFSREHPGLFGVGFIETNSGAYQHFDAFGQMIASYLDDQRRRPEQAAAIRGADRRRPARPQRRHQVRQVAPAPGLRGRARPHPLPRRGRQADGLAAPRQTRPASTDADAAAWPPRPAPRGSADDPRGAGRAQGGSPKGGLRLHRQGHRRHRRGRRHRQRIRPARGRLGRDAGDRRPRRGPGQGTGRRPPAANPGHLSIGADLTDQQQIEAVMARVQRAFGRIDVLVNNTGMTSTERFADRSLESMDREILVNTLSPLYVTRLALPLLRRSADPRVITTVSLAGIFPQAETPIYCASKFALRGAMLSIAMDLRAEGITVCSVLPSATDTRMLHREAITGGNLLQFQDPPQTPEVVAATMMRLLDRPRLEAYPKPRESYLVRAVMAVPNMLFVLMPFFEGKGVKGHQATCAS